MALPFLLARARAHAPAGQGGDCARCFWQTANFHPLDIVCAARRKIPQSSECITILNNNKKKRTPINDLLHTFQVRAPPACRRLSTRIGNNSTTLRVRRMRFVTDQRCTWNEIKITFIPMRTWRVCVGFCANYYVLVVFFFGGFVYVVRMHKPTLIAGDFIFEFLLLRLRHAMHNIRKCTCFASKSFKSIQALSVFTGAPRCIISINHDDLGQMRVSVVAELSCVCVAIDATLTRSARRIQQSKTL